METEKEALLAPIFEYMVAYLLGGYVNPEITTGYNVDDATGLNLDTALKIRFLLDEATEEFLRKIKVCLRGIRTEVSSEKNRIRGAAKGQIDWKRTIQTWASSRFIDKTLLHVSRPVKNYDIPENLVLKKTISILNNFMNDKKVGTEIDGEYTWSKQLQESRKHVKEALKNVYFRRIMDSRKIRITPRMKNQVRNSRKEIYREGCRVLDNYEKVFFNHELSKLLKETFIDPDNIERTFELLCLFTIIKILNKKMGWELKSISEITGNRNETARLVKSDFEINFFYNVTGELEFYDTTEPPQITEAIKSITLAYFGKKLRDNTRRPDIILELKSVNEEEKIIVDYAVFEVKYTRNRNYIIQGISQVLHYLHDLKVKGKGCFFEDNFGGGYNAAVIVRELIGNINDEQNLANHNLAVKIFDFNDLVGISDSIRVFLHEFLTANKVTCTGLNIVASS